MKRREFIALVGGAAAGYPTVAPAQPATQSDALNTYNKAVNDFRSILGRRRAQIDSKQPLPDLPGPKSIAALTSMGVQRILLHEKLFPQGVYPPLIGAIEGDPMFHLETVSADHLGEVRVYAFLPGFGPREPVASR